MTLDNPNRNPRARWAWAMYDWANSVYALVITTAIFPIYFHAVAASDKVATQVLIDADGVTNAYVPFLGFEVKSISLLSFGVAIAYILIGVLSPLLGAVADYSGAKKKFMMFFCGIGSLSCSLMYFFTDETFYLGFWLFVLAGFGYAGGNIFNDAFLPEITTPDKYDRMSARGFALGYIGSVLLLLFNLSMLMMPGIYFDVDGKAAELLAANPMLGSEEALSLAGSSFTATACRISLLSVGIWWFLFAQFTFWNLKDVKPAYKPKNYLTEGFRELRGVMAKLRELRALKRFLLAFLFYNMGMQTIMYMGSSFGSVELKMESSQLIIFVLIIQLIAIPGAYLFAWLSEKYGNFKGLSMGIVVWILVCVMAYFVTDANGFYIVGVFTGLIMGGMQSLSRSTYSKLIPVDTHDNASFFSFFAITDKIAIVGGTLTFAILSNTIGTRPTIIALIAFFLLGGGLVYTLIKEKPVLSDQLTD